MSCAHVFKSGKRKGKACGRTTSNHGSYCTKHTPVVSAHSPQFLETLDLLQLKYLALDTTFENKAIILKKMRYLDTLSVSSTEYQKNLNWLRHALNFPYNKLVKTPVSVKTSNCRDISEYVTAVFEKLDSYIYGMPDVKEELLTFVAKRISNPNSTDHVLALQGGNGVGKTKLAHGLARALDLPIKTVNLGSVNDVSYFTGHGFTYVDSEPGRIVQILNETQCKNCIIYFDELDKIHKTDKGQSIYGFLTHLIDPTQNTKYQDVYLSGLELDVSNVFFVFSYNDEEQIDATVKDRLKIIRVKDPTYDDKINIAEKFIVPEICANINYNVTIDRAIIEKIVSQDTTRSGLRGIKRVLEDIIAKMNVVRLLDETVRDRMSFYDHSEETMINNIVRSHRDESDRVQHMYL